jgi:PAS domain S-box-containing protein
LVSPRERSVVTRYGVAVLALCGAVYARQGLSSWLGETSFAFLLPAVFVSAWFGGTWVGVGATLVGAVIATAGFPEPFVFNHPSEWTRLLLFTTNAAFATGICAILHHVVHTSRASANEAARNFEIMANNAPVLIWSTDADGRCRFVNRNWLAFTGRPLERGPDARRPGQLHPGDAGRYETVSQEAIAARAPFQIEYRLRRADGTYRWLLEHAVPRCDRDGNYDGYIGSCSDVTDSHNEREELTFIGRVQAALAESLDLDKCAEVLVQSFVPRFADWCSIELVDEQGRLERVRVHHLDRGEVTPLAVKTTGRFAPGESDGLAAQIVKTGEPQLVRQADDALLRILAYDEAHYQRLRSVGPVSYLGVPLRARGRIVGVLALATAESGRTLQHAEQRLVQKIAGLAGFALENAQLYRSARQALAAEEHALHEMQRSERRFRFMWDANIFGMGTIGRSGRILSANAALAELLHFTPEEIASGRARLGERTPAAWHAADERANLELQMTGRCAPFEKEFVRPDGTTVQVLVCGSLLPNSDECMTFVLDLTARKHAERALDRQRLLLNTIIDAMPAMVAYIGPDERFWLHNEKYRKWLGIEAGEINGRTMRELLGEESHDKLAPYLNAAFRGRNMRHETTLRSANRERHLIASYRPDRDVDNRVVGVVIHAYDITERKETEQALADALTRYRFLADAMPHMVWTSLPDGHLDYVNRRWLEITGMTEIASLGRENWLEAVHPDDRNATHTHWRQALTQCIPFEHECRLRCGDGDTWRWHLVRALPRRDDHNVVVQWVGSATDIDEQRRAYAELAEARARLKSHAEELEARVRARTATLREANAELEAFTYSVSHDLRTPLQFVRGFAEAIRSDSGGTLSPESVDYLHRIIRAASRMDTIIQDLLGYSRLSRSEMQLVEISLEDLVSDVLAHHHATIKQTRAVLAIDRPLPSVFADKTGLFQAVSNLVSNALKFTRPGHLPHIRIRCDRTEQGIRLWVEDNGIGIDRRHHERIFQLFERLHSPADYPGTGIGLSLVRKAVSRMGGQCGVESAPDHGSRFWLEFPHSVPAALSHAST